MHNGRGKVRSKLACGWSLLNMAYWHLMCKLDWVPTNPAHFSCTWGSSSDSLLIMATQEDQLVPEAPIQGSDYPPHWQPQVSMTETFSLSRGTSEWNWVVQRVKETLQDAWINKVFRIQNQWLWEKYAAHKKRLQLKNSGYTNEKYPFHGKRGNNPKLIYESEEGFDMRFSERGKWGTANYFAQSASYSNHYAHMAQDGTSLRQIFLAEVLTGYSCNSPPNSELRMPPLMPPESNTARVHFTQQRYDTVTGVTGGSQVYMTYDNDKSYPAYLIEYSIK